MKYGENELKALELDARFADVGNLPSNFLPYNFKKLLVRPFTVRELRLLSKAAVLKEAIHLHRAIDLVISEDINDISIGDFYYLLMWLRIHSMPKTPYVIEWHCDSKVLIDKDFQRLFHDDLEYATKSQAVGLEEIDCLTHNSEIVHMSDVEIISLDDTFEALPVLDDESVVLDFPRVRNLVEIQEAIGDPELRLIAGAAQWIRGDSTTLSNKIEVLENQPNLDVFDAASVVNEQIVHGIKETVILSCRGCGAKRVHTLALDALSFFR